jgi:hypothetical protein
LITAAGFIPKELLTLADSIPGGLTLLSMDMIAQRVGAAGGSAGGLSVLFGQSLMVLPAFLLGEKKVELAVLIEELNQTK